MRQRVPWIACLLIVAAGGEAVTARGEAARPPRVVDIKSVDGTLIRATYFSPGKPGPGAVLFHQSNRTRDSWKDLAARLAAAGLNTLMVDMRGSGETAGKWNKENWPQDLDAIFDFIVSQPGVQRDVIGFGGAGVSGVEDAVEAARRHPAAVKSLVLMSGETSNDGLRFLREASQLPELFVVDDNDEYPPVPEAMELLYVTATSPSRKFVHYSASHDAPWLWYEPFDVGRVPATGSHGTDLFQTHGDLPGLVVDWFVTTLLSTPGHAPADTVASADVLRQIQRGDLAPVAKRLTELRRTDRQAQLFPEIAASSIGQNDQRAGDTKNAVAVLELVLLAYPDSADAHETLSEAYAQDGRKDLARQHAEKALAILDTPNAPASSWTNTEQYRGEIRRGAQKVLEQVKARPSAATERAPGAVFLDCPECPEMVVVPAGRFTMGSSTEEKAWAASHGGSKDAVADEAPQHEVTLPAFALGRYDVTRGEFAAFVRETGHPAGDGCGVDSFKWDKDASLSWQKPGFEQSDRDPVVCVSWQDAQAYIAWLNGKVGSARGGPYRLPSEAEWEYAARAGTTTRFWWGDADADAPGHAWFEANSVGRTHPVGQKPANAFGLHDMAGDVWQWTEDCYADTYAGAPADGRAVETPKDCRRVDRGASWLYPAWLLRSATRERNPADFRDRIMGFRVARTLP